MSDRGPSFDIPKEDIELIAKIMDRLSDYCNQHDIYTFVRTFAQMDLTATHANGCPMDLEKLLAADDFEFQDDLNGITLHLNRETGKLMDGFVPKFAVKE